MAIRKDLVDAKCNTGQTHTFQAPAFFTFELCYNPECTPYSDNPDNPAPIPEIIFKKYVEPNEDGSFPPTDESQKQIVAPLDKSLHEELVLNKKTGEKEIEYILTRVDKYFFTMAVPTEILKQYFNGEEFSILYDSKLSDNPKYIYHKLDSSNPYDSSENVMPTPEEMDISDEGEKSNSGQDTDTEQNSESTNKQEHAQQKNESYENPKKDKDNDSSS